MGHFLLLGVLDLDAQHVCTVHRQLLARTDHMQRWQLVVRLAQ
jgi:hypothetical protein